MRKFAVLYITPILSVLIALLHFPYFEKLLTGKWENADLYIAGGFVALLLLNHFITIFSPFKRYEKLDREKWSFLNSLIEPLNQEYERFGIKFNVMVPKIRIITKLEPRINRKGEERRKISFFRNVFHFVWWSEDGTINRQLEMTVRQGVAGKVFNDGKAFVYNFMDDETFNMNLSQMEMTQNLKLIVSVAIRGYDHEHPGKPTNKVLGVINAESELEDARTFFEDRGNRKKIIDNLIRLSKVCRIII